MVRIILLTLFIFIQNFLFAQKKDTAILRNIAAMEKEVFLKKRMESGNSTGSDYDVKYHRVHWYIDPDTLYVKGNVFTLFRISGDSATEITFDLTSLLQVDSVVSHHVQMPFSHNGNLLHIPLPEIFYKGSYDSLCVYYQGTPDTSVGFGSFKKGFHGGVPMIWTLSEPYGASDWWPCKNTLTDKIDSMDIFITTSSHNTAVSNGKLAEVYSNGSNKTYYWQHRYPITTYLVALAVTNYYAFTDYAVFGNDTMDILHYCYPEDTAAAFENAFYTAGIMHYFGTFFGDYPFKKEKYGHAQFGWGGGMENQTITFIGGYNYGLIVHELAHSWFGNKVTCGSFQDLWLNEGFATYLSGFLYDWDPTVFRNWKKSQIEYITSEPGGSVFVRDTSDVNRLFDGRLTYTKGGMLVHLLRYLLGDENFFKAIRNYLDDPGLAYVYARTADLKKHLEAACACDLAYVFDAWLYGEGYPVYKIRCTRYPENDVSVAVTQFSVPASSSFFRMKIPVRFYGQGEDTTFYLENTFSGQVFWVNPGFRTDSVVFNPEYDIITKDSRIALDSSSQYPAAIIISPNPFYDTITITQNNTSVSKIEMFDATGARVFVSEKYRTTGETYNINLTNLRKGSYVIRIKTGKGTENFKVVKI